MPHAQPPLAPWPASRPRRMRAQPWMRRMVRENRLAPADLIWPIFIIDGENRTEPVASMPGVERMSIDVALKRIEEAAALGVSCVALFPYTDPALKTPDAREAWNADNLVCRATRAVKRDIPQIGVMLDVALDPYNSDGHDGVVRDGRIVNDESIEALVRQTLAQAEAGADILGPSDMMDGRVGAMRAALEENGFQDTAIMTYGAKYASSFYGPFRDAVGAGEALKGADAPGDKKTYQMDPANGDEAMREIALDIAEGADMVMVKPGMPYLDICRRAKDAFALPTFAYQVSGEYAMLCAAAQRGWLSREAVMMESLTAFRRAGCDGILTYFAIEAARMLKERGAPASGARTGQGGGQV